MDIQELKYIIHQGENNPVEFKRCGNQPEKDLFESAGLYGKDYTTGKPGYKLAAVILLGKDESIRSLCPTYKADALLRQHDEDRYEDRLP